MLNILYVFGGEKASGAEKVIDRLINYNANNVNAHLFIAPGDFAQSLKSSNSKYRKIVLVNQLKKLNRSKKSALLFYLSAIKNYFSVSCQVYRYIKKQDIQIVHANTVVPASYLLLAIFYSKIFKPKIRYIWSDHDLQYFSGIDHKLAGLCVKFYDLTLAVSEAVKNKYHDPVQSKVIVLYNGLNIQEYQAQPDLRATFHQEFNIVKDQIVIGIAANIEPRKGQLRLIKAFEKLNKDYPHVSLFLAGPTSSDHAAYVEEVITMVSSNTHILYLGKLNDMFPFYNGCDIIISNSSTNGSEPLGTTIYEAMAMEKIVLASATGGSPEIVSDQYDGFLFTPDDENDLYHKLSYAVGNFSSLNHIGKQARTKVDGKFNIAIMAKKYNHVINSLMSAKISI